LLAEKSLIAAIRRLAQASRNQSVLRGIGDDCALLRPQPGFELLVTTDLSIEGVHFRRVWHPARSVGHRCLARGLSDIAAMGGEPLACFLSLGLPSNLPETWTREFIDGLMSLARSWGVELAGGDVSSAAKITADIVVMGQVPRGQSILRSGAQPGDRIFVTGQLGASASVLRRLLAGERIRPSRSSRHFFPEPRLEVARLLRERRLATSMIDLSDGLSIDLNHICEESRVAARISSADIPIARNADLELALHGGEDYELLFTAPSKARVPRQIAGIAIAEIGVVLGEPAPPKSKRSRAGKDYSSAMEILDDNGRATPLAPLGWQHFRKK
jgi:thiamine-monophosphate kinase